MLLEAGHVSRGFEGCIQVYQVESREVARFPSVYFRASSLGAALPAQHSWDSWCAQRGTRLCWYVWEVVPTGGQDPALKTYSEVVQREFQDGSLQRKFLVGAPRRPVIQEGCLVEVSLEKRTGR